MIRLFIEKHMAIFGLAALIVIVGVVAYIGLPRESAPEITQPYIFITTGYVGVSAADIESLVTQRIEQELDGVDGLLTLTSESRQNLSFIFAEFSSDVTVETALQRVKDRVDLARPQLPADSDDPLVREFSVSDWPFYVLVLSHPDGVGVLEEGAELISEAIKRLPGVLDVDTTGKPTREVAIELDAYRMASYGFSIDDVTGAIRQEHVSIPGGVMRNPERNYNLSITGELTEVREFEDLYVSANGVAVRLADISTIAMQESLDETRSRLNGQPAITLSVRKRIGANILDVAESIRVRVAEMDAELPAGTEITVSYDESRYISNMIADLENNMASGFLLVIAVTVFFLGLRNSLFVSLAIPLSMLLSFFILQLFSITLNMIVLFSLILALGMLVDNGIVIVENIFRHASMGKDRVQAAVDGAGEVAAPIMVSTLTTVLAFFPIIFMPGLMGDFMKYLPMTVIVVLGSSLLVAVVINPVFCGYFLNVSPRQQRRITEGGGGFIRLQSWYTAVLRLATRHALKSTLLITAVVILGITAFVLFGREPLFFPDLDPERARITVDAPQGTPLRYTDAIVRQAEDLVRTTPSSLESYAAIAGSDGSNPESHRGRVDITFVPFNERIIRGRDAVRAIGRRVGSITGAVVTIEEADEGPPTGNDVSYEIRGTDYEVLGDISARILAVLQGYAEFRSADTDYEPGRPEYAVRIDRGRAALHDVATANIANTVRTAINGATVGTFRHKREEYDIVVRYRQSERDSVAALRNVMVVSNDGVRVPLSSVADIEPQSATGVIKRRNMNRAVSVWADFDANIPNRAAITRDIEAQVEALRRDLPRGYVIGSGEGADIRNESTQFLVQAFVIAVFLIFIVLLAQFNSLADPFIILFGVFLSLGGVMWGFAFAKLEFVIIMSGIGCIALAGVAVNNCIVLVDYTQRLIAAGMPWRQAVIEAGRTRLRPVILTALTTVLALVPMALGISLDIHGLSVQFGSESAEWWRAFAWTMLYGLSFATISTLVAVPSMLSLKYRWKERPNPGGAADAVT
ncbi:MAG: efflux RND transporter permease subunit [Spirochaetaceae bacterium]|nr:MAG: efflux RND transporter permease subunit [Spirochaetaceae bacterium]